MKVKEYIERESWRSRIGFIFAALGSAVGLGSIWRFPYVVGENGGAAFILLYLFCLLLIGFPVLICEILVGRTAQSSPYGSFRLLGGNRVWGWGGYLTIFTGFIISSFYSVIAGWTLGYLFQALKGNLTHFTSVRDALHHFQALSGSAGWCVGFHFLFIFLCVLVLISGVRKGIEIGSKIMMPLLILVLIVLVIKGLTLPSSFQALRFLFAPDFKSLSPAAIVLALGQAFFTLSLGQGTMVTYGSYLSRKEDIPRSVIPVVLLNTAISLLVGVAVFCIVFSVGLKPEAGPALIFETLPIVFSQLSWGWGLAVLFFILVALAALTSEISALEPVISYLIDERGWERKKAVLISSGAAFLLGIPTAFSFNLWKNVEVFGATFYTIVSFISVNILVPLGGLLAVLLVGWRWGMREAFDNLKMQEEIFHHSRPILARYFQITIKFTAPILIILILLNLLGIY